MTKQKFSKARILKTNDVVDKSRILVDGGGLDYIHSRKGLLTGKL